MGVHRYTHYWCYSNSVEHLSAEHISIPTRQLWLVHRWIHMEKVVTYNHSDYTDYHIHQWIDASLRYDMSAILDTIWTRRHRIAEKRMAICNQCEFLKRFNQCDKCGCFMDAKTHFLDSECPINKWGAENINMNEPFDFGEE